MPAVLHWAVWSHATILHRGLPCQRPAGSSDSVFADLRDTSDLPVRRVLHQSLQERPSEEKRLRRGSLDAVRSFEPVRTCSRAMAAPALRISPCEYGEACANKTSDTMAIRTTLARSEMLCPKNAGMTYAKVTISLSGQRPEFRFDPSVIFRLCIVASFHRDPLRTSSPLTLSLAFDI